jgi:aspartate racemase
LLAKIHKNTILNDRAESMKTIGLIGGMSWESTALYYQIINREVARRQGGLHSAKCNLVSLDFGDIAARQARGDWAGMATILSDAAVSLQCAGADCVLIATNTMHKLAHTVQSAVTIPLLHIADATAAAVKANGCDTVGLLGTRFTMEQPFLIEHYAAQGVRCIVPNAADRMEVHRIIFEELCRGTIAERSRTHLRDICGELSAQGAQGVILGCTELTMLLKNEHVPLPLFDTTSLHALAAVDFSMAH